MLKLARWIADYYAATIEQAIRTVLPCAVRRKGAGFIAQTHCCLGRSRAGRVGAGYLA